MMNQEQDKQETEIVLRVKVDAENKQSVKAENTDTKEKGESEIDLLQISRNAFLCIANFIRSIFKGLGCALIAIIRFKVRNFRSLCIAALIGILLGAGYFFTQKPRFEGEAHVLCNGFPNHLLDENIQKLNELIKGNNPQILADRLNISLPIAEAINSLEMGYGIDLDNDGIANEVSYNEKGKLNEIEEIITSNDQGVVTEIRNKTLRGRISGSAYLKVNTNTLDEKVFNQITWTVYRYIYEDPILKIRHQNNSIQIHDRIKELEFQIVRLDSLQRIHYTEIARSKKHGSVDSDKVVFTSYQEKDIQLFHSEMLALSNEKIELENQLRSSPKDITIVSDFQPVLRKKGPIVCAFLGIVLSCLIAICIAIYRENKVQISKFIKDSKNS